MTPDETGSNPAPSAKPEILDLRGYRCPVPVLRLEAWLRKAPQGAQALVLSDDPIAKIDIPHACAEAGHKIVTMAAGPGECGFQVTKGSNHAKQR